MNEPTIDAIITPENHLAVLSKLEINQLLDTSRAGLYQLFHNCALAVLNCGNQIDSGKELLDRFSSFSIKIIQVERGIKLDVKGAPNSAFVEGEMIKGIKEHLFSVLRDIVYVGNEIKNSPKHDLQSSDGISNAVFHILRNANILHFQTEPNLVVCWGGHAISREEYSYTKEIGYQLGLRSMNICTGCGPGAMKGPMKGATIGHSKQRIHDGKYIGITEPGIIAAESPNPIVNNLVILPDIEKRLEAFVRAGHGFIVFPGGAGTAEEIIYILGILLHPDNAELPFPLIFTGPKCSEDYFKQINQFIGVTLGYEAQQRYKIIIDDPSRVAREIKKGIKLVREFRKNKSDAYYFNWSLKISSEFQHPFDPTHQNMANLKLDKNQKPHQLAANLRRVFSGIVSGNVKDEGIRAIEKHGFYQINGDIEIMEPIDQLLSAFVKQHRMKLQGADYQPCYNIVKSK